MYAKINVRLAKEMNDTIHQVARVGRAIKNRDDGRLHINWRGTSTGISAGGWQWMTRGEEGGT